MAKVEGSHSQNIDLKSISGLLETICSENICIDCLEKEVSDD